MTVDFTALGELVDSLAAHINAIEDELGEMEQIVQDLESSWEGDAQKAFHEAVAEWSSAARDLRDQLGWIRGLVVTAHDNHATAVRTNVAIWRA